MVALWQGQTLPLGTEYMGEVGEVEEVELMESSTVEREALEATDM
jgi:hypothetical protein